MTPLLSSPLPPLTYYAELKQSVTTGHGVGGAVAALRGDRGQPHLQRHSTRRGHDEITVLCPRDSTANTVCQLRFDERRQQDPQGTTAPLFLPLP